MLAACARLVSFSMPRVTLFCAPFQASVEFQAVLVQVVVPHLRAALHAQHYVDHKCEHCAVPVVTLDAKYGLTCALCNHREGGVVEFPQVQCSVMFGCQKPPMQSGLYCCDHQPSAGCASARADAQRIVRHRDENGVRSYKVDGSPQWFSSSQLSVHALREYEGLLAEKKTRKKRCRGQLLEAAGGDGHAPEDAPYFDAVEPIMNPQPDDVNPCGIDKAATLPRRKYGGLLVATLPCGSVCAVACLQPFDPTLTSWLSILFTYNQWHEGILFSCPPLPQPLLFTTLLPSVIPSVAAPCLPRCIHWPTPSRSLKCTACCRPCSIEVTMLWRMPFMTTLVLWPAMRATRCVVTERRRRRPSLPSPSSSTAPICRITRRASLKATTSSCPKFDARGIPSSLASTHRLPNSSSLGPTPLCDPRLP